MRLLFAFTILVVSIAIFEARSFGGGSGSNGEMSGRGQSESQKGGMGGEQQGRRGGQHGGMGEEQEGQSGGKRGGMAGGERGGKHGDMGGEQEGQFGGKRGGMTGGEQQGQRGGKHGNMGGEQQGQAEGRRGGMEGGERGGKHGDMGGKQEGLFGGKRGGMTGERGDKHGNMGGEQGQFGGPHGAMGGNMGAIKVMDKSFAVLAGLRRLFESKYNFSDPTSVSLLVQSLQVSTCDNDTFILWDVVPLFFRLTILKQLNYTSNLTDWNDLPLSIQAEIKIFASEKFPISPDVCISKTLLKLKINELIDPLVDQAIEKLKTLSFNGFASHLQGQAQGEMGVKTRNWQSSQQRDFEEDEDDEADEGNEEDEAGESDEEEDEGDEGDDGDEGNEGDEGDEGDDSDEEEDAGDEGDEVVAAGDVLVEDSLSTNDNTVVKEKSASDVKATDDAEILQTMQSNFLGRFFNHN